MDNSILKRYMLGLIFDESLISQQDHKYYLASQQVFLIAGIIHVLFMAQFFLLGIHELAYFNMLSILMFVYAIHLNRKKHHIASLWLAYVEVNVHAVAAVHYIGWGAGYYIYLLTIAAMLFYYPKYKTQYKFILSLISIILLCLLYIYRNDSVYTLDSNVISFLYLSNMVYAFCLLGYMAHYYAVGSEKTETFLRKLSKEYEKLAIRDSLTGLLNRRAFMQEVHGEAADALTHNDVFVLVMCDIDNFKSYNDRYGHAVGDRVLKHVSDVMVKNCRTYDTVARWGGEEFIILLRHCRLDDAAKIVNKLRKTLENNIIFINEHTISVTMTFGLHEYDRSISIENCVDMADHALLYGKRHDKNCVVTANQNIAGEFLCLNEA